MTFPKVCLAFEFPSSSWQKCQKLLKKVSNIIFRVKLVHMLSFRNRMWPYPMLLAVIPELCQLLNLLHGPNKWNQTVFNYFLKCCCLPVGLDSMKRQRERLPRNWEIVRPGMKEWFTQHRTLNFITSWKSDFIPCDFIQRELLYAHKSLHPYLYRIRQHLFLGCARNIEL